MTKKTWIIIASLFLVILFLGFVSSFYCYDLKEIDSSKVCDGNCNCDSCEDENNCPDDCTDTCSSLGYECGWYTICDKSKYCGGCDYDEDCIMGTCYPYCDPCYNKECYQGDVWCYDCHGNPDHVFHTCWGDTPICHIDDCVECLADPDCGDYETCNANHECVECTPNCAGKQCGDDGCGGTCPPGCSGSKPECDTSTGKCVKCITGSTRCSGGELQQCVSETWITQTTCDDVKTQNEGCKKQEESCVSYSPGVAACEWGVWEVQTGLVCSTTSYCSGNGYYDGKTCSSSGTCTSGYNYHACSGSTPYCSVDVECVECTSSSHCTAVDYRYGGDPNYCQKREDSCFANECEWGSWTSINKGKVCSSTNFCSGDGYYDGKTCSSGGTCSENYGYTACPDASCSSDGDGTYTALGDSVCSAGKCTTQSSTDCGAYACSGTSCATSCTSNANCASSYVCEGGTCDLCTLSSASWSVSTAREGETVTLNVIGSHCAGKTITFKIYDKNDNPIDTLTHTYSSTDWDVEWISGGSPYYFKALFASEAAMSGDLIVTGCGDGIINGNETCDGSDTGGCHQCDMDTGIDPETCVCAEYCGDGTVQTPNDNGFDEKCDNVPGCTGCVWVPEGFWADSDGDEIATKAVVLDTTTIYMALKYTGFASGTPVSFEIREQDLLSSDYIKTIDDTTNSAGAATAEWIPTQEDMDKTTDYNKFFFIVKDGSENEIVRSGYLDITIKEENICEFVSSCSDYVTEDECEGDAELCGVAEASIGGTLPGGATCGQEGFECDCYWDGSKCGPRWIYAGYCGDGFVAKWTGEQCEDDSDITLECTDWDDFTGGDLHCINCIINTNDCALNQDTDDDGIPDGEDSDMDGDGIPDSEDPDIDGDGIPNEDDPYPYAPGGDTDTDGDGIPDYLDPDMDGDGIPNDEDPDIDGDGIPNEDDPYPYVPNDTDTDGDGIPDNQDPDIDGDGIPNGEDPYPYTPDDIGLLCGNGWIDLGEQCESDADLTGVSCSDFDDYTGEGLFCNSNCLADTSDCEGGEIGGSCSYLQTEENECDEEPLNLFTYSWTGVWDGVESGDAYLECIAGGRATIECPAQVQLPFFGFYNVIIALVAIAFVYISLIFRRKKRS